MKFNTSLTQIYKTKKYIYENHDIEQAIELGKILNYYKYSLTFRLFNGIALTQQLHDEYNFTTIDDDDKKMYKFIIPLLADDLLLLLYFILFLIISILVWLPKWKQDSYTSGFNNNNNNPRYHACAFAKKDCSMCDFYIDNNTIKQINNCDGKPTINCSFIDLQYIKWCNKTFVKNIDAENYAVFMSKHNHAQWYIYICDRVAQADYMVHIVIIKFAFCFLILFVVGMLVNYYCLKIIVRDILDY